MLRWCRTAGRVDQVPLTQTPRVDQTGTQTRVPRQAQALVRTLTQDREHQIHHLTLHVRESVIEEDVFLADHIVTLSPLHLPQDQGDKFATNCILSLF